MLTLLQEPAQAPTPSSPRAPQIHPQHALRDADLPPPHHQARLPARRHELLWFVSGNTSPLPLSAAGIKIWDGNGSREYLDSVGLSHREVGDLGPVYGFQWRHFGAQYVDAKTDYTGQGVDQLAEVIHKLRNNPYDRRTILSAWNLADLKKMALPPYHMFAQFYVSYPSGEGWRGQWCGKRGREAKRPPPLPALPTVL